MFLGSSPELGIGSLPTSLPTNPSACYGVHGGTLADMHTADGAAGGCLPVRECDPARDLVLGCDVNHVMDEAAAAREAGLLWAEFPADEKAIGEVDRFGAVVSGLADPVGSTDDFLDLRLDELRVDEAVVLCLGTASGAADVIDAQSMAVRASTSEAVEAGDLAAVEVGGHVARPAPDHGAEADLKITALAVGGVVAEDVLLGSAGSHSKQPNRSSRRSSRRRRKALQVRSAEQLISLAAIASTHFDLRLQSLNTFSELVQVGSRRRGRSEAMAVAVDVVSLAMYADLASSGSSASDPFPHEMAARVTFALGGYFGD
jgi:hypothetical protein